MTVDGLLGRRARRSREASPLKKQLKAVFVLHWDHEAKWIAASHEDWKQDEKRLERRKLWKCWREHREIS